MRLDFTYISFHLFFERVDFSLILLDDLRGFYGLKGGSHFDCKGPKRAFAISGLDVMISKIFHDKFQTTFQLIVFIEKRISTKIHHFMTSCLFPLQSKSYCPKFHFSQREVSSSCAFRSFFLF